MDENQMLQILAQLDAQQRNDQLSQLGFTNQLAQNQQNNQSEQQFLANSRADYVPSSGFTPGVTNFYGANQGGGGGGGGGFGTYAGLSAMAASRDNSQQAEADAAAQRALQLQIANMNHAIDQGRLNLDTQLGTGNLQLGQSRLALDDLLGKRSQQLQASEQFGARSTRQLSAPRGHVLPSLQPIVGRSQI